MGALSYVRISAEAKGGKGNNLKYRLHRILLKKKTATRTARPIVPGPARKMHEVLPLTGPIDVDGALSEPAWQA